MQFMDTEEIVSESDGKQMILTTLRVRHTTKRWGKVRVTSLLLEELDSCEIRSVSNPILLVLAALIALGAFAIGDEAIAIGLVLGLSFVAIYYFTRTQVISIKSASSVINLRTS